MLPPQHVELLERTIESAIADACRRLAREGKFRAIENPRLAHLMAKAAVAVYEAVEENSPQPRQ